MDRVEELEVAIASLPDEEFSRIARWIHERDQALWDRQIDDDASSGKLDFLIAEAEQEASEGRLRAWPPEK